MKDGAGDPAMALIEIGVAAIAVGIAVVLRVEEGGKVGGVVDGVRPGPARKQFKMIGEALGDSDGESIVDGIAGGGLRLDVLQGTGTPGPVGNPPACARPTRVA